MSYISWSYICTYLLNVCLIVLKVMRVYIDILLSTKTHVLGSSFYANYLLNFLKHLKALKKIKALMYGSEKHIVIYNCFGGNWCSLVLNSYLIIHPIWPSFGNGSISLDEIWQCLPLPLIWIVKLFSVCPCRMIWKQIILEICPHFAWIWYSTWMPEYIFWLAEVWKYIYQKPQCFLKQNFYRNDLCLILNKIPIIVRFQHLTWLSLTIVISYEPIYEIYVWNMAAIEGSTDPQVLIFKLQVTRQPTTKYAWLWTRKRNAGTFGTWGI